jgi:hypothetical protein
MMFDPASRYASVADATVTVTAPDGTSRTVTFKRRRFVPPAGVHTTLVEHTVAQGERLDNVTARYLGDPTRFWQVCDANQVLDPAELERAGRIIRIAVQTPGVGAT